MRKKVQKLSVEKTLGSMHLRDLDVHSLENAKTRVWNKLSHSIDKLESTNKMSQIEPIAPQKTFWDKYHKSFLSFGVVALVIASTVGTTAYLTIKDKKANEVAQNTTPQTNDSNSLDDIKLAAAARFETLTGITYDEYKVVAANAKNTEANAQADTQVLKNTAGANGRGSTAMATTQLAPTVDPERIKELATKAETKNTKVFYTETEVVIANTNNLDQSQFGMGLPGVPYGNSPLIDLKKPLTMKTWFGSNYSKEVLSQDGKVISMHIYTPEFDLDYRGGMYAVRSNHINNTNYFIGVIEGEDQNPDLQFIKYILSDDSNFKKVGTKVVDGKTLTIYEDSLSLDMISSAPMDTKLAGGNFKSKYYVDTEQLQVKMVEYYVNDALVSSMSKKASKEITTDGAKVIADYSEINGVEVKSIDRDNMFVYEMPNQKIVDFMQKYPVLYIGNESISSVYDNSYFNEQQKNDPYSKLVNTKDFDPAYGTSANDPAMPFMDGPVGGYGQFTTYYNIYKNRPTRFDTTQPEDAKYRTVEKSNVSLNIEGRTVQGIRYKETFNYENIPGTIAGDNIKIAPMSTESYTVIFEYNGVWYEINESVGKADQKQSLDGNPINISNLTREDALRMDRENKERQDAFVELEYGAKLSDISKDIRYLPGDLSQTLKLEAMMLAKSMPKSQNKPCEKFEETLNTQCIISKFGGFQIDFSQRLDGTKAELIASPFPTNYHQFIVVNAKLSDVQPLIDKISNGRYSAKFGGSSVVSREIDGKTILVSYDTEENKATASKILDGVKLDNGFNVLSSQLEKSSQPIKAMPVEMMKQ